MAVRSAAALRAGELVNTRFILQAGLITYVLSLGRCHSGACPGGSSAALGRSDAVHWGWGTAEDCLGAGGAAASLPPVVNDRGSPSALSRLLRIDY